MAIFTFYTFGKNCPRLDYMDLQVDLCDLVSNLEEHFLVSWYTMFQAHLVLAWPSSNWPFLQASPGFSVGRLVCPLAAFSQVGNVASRSGLKPPCRVAAMLCRPCLGACPGCPSGMMLSLPCSGPAWLLRCWHRCLLTEPFYGEGL